MENKLADFLTDEKIPKALRFLTLAAVICFVEWILLGVAMLMPYMAGKVILFALAALMLPVAVRLAIKIYRS